MDLGVDGGVDFEVEIESIFRMVSVRCDINSSLRDACCSVNCVNKDC